MCCVDTLEGTTFPLKTECEVSFKAFWKKAILGDILKSQMIYFFNLKEKQVKLLVAFNIFISKVRKSVFNTCCGLNMLIYLLIIFGSLVIANVWLESCNMERIQQPNLVISGLLFGNNRLIQWWLEKKHCFNVFGRSFVLGNHSSQY